MKAQFALPTLLVALATAQTETNVDWKIVHGTEAKEGEFPFMLSLRRSASNKHYCGATLLNRQWALTAAHCVGEVLPESINVEYGSIELLENATQVARVSKIYAHEGYNASDKHVHDVALLKLSSALTLNNLVGMVRLPAQNQDLSGNLPATLLGWGLNMHVADGHIQTKLLKVDLQTFPDQECEKRFKYRLHGTHLCAGFLEGYKGQYNGDSGGPLLVQGMQAGIVSRSVRPGVFTEVSAYVDWILTVIAQDAQDEGNEDKGLRGEEEQQESEYEYKPESDLLKQITTGDLYISFQRNPLEDHAHAMRHEQAELGNKTPLDD